MVLRTWRRFRGSGGGPLRAGLKRYKPNYGKAVTGVTKSLPDGYLAGGKSGCDGIFVLGHAPTLLFGFGANERPFEGIEPHNLLKDAIAVAVVLLAGASAVLIECAFIDRFIV